MLLITAVYVLPVKELLCNQEITAVADLDDEKAENGKLEKSKELFPLPIPGFNIYRTTAGFTFHITPSVPVLLQTVISPPPDTQG